MPFLKTEPDRQTIATALAGARVLRSQRPMDHLWVYIAGGVPPVLAAFCLYEASAVADTDPASSPERAGYHGC